MDRPRRRAERRDVSMAGEAHRGRVAREFAVPGGQFVTYLAAVPLTVLNLAQEASLLAQGPLAGREVAEVRHHRHRQALIEVTTAQLRFASHQIDALGLEVDGRKMAHQVGAPREGLPVHLEATASPTIEGILARLGPAVRREPDLQGDVQVIAREGDEVLAAGAAARAAERREIERFEEVGLALAVAAEQDVHATGELEGRVGEIAESRQADRVDAHAAAKSPASRNGISRQSTPISSPVSCTGLMSAALCESFSDSTTDSACRFFRMSWR